MAVRVENFSRQREAAKKRRLLNITQKTRAESDWIFWQGATKIDTWPV